MGTNPPYNGTRQAHDADFSAGAAAIDAVQTTQGDPLPANASTSDSTTRATTSEKARPRVLIADIEGKIAADDEFSQSLAYNELKGKAVVTGPLPWDGANDREREWDSYDDSFYMRWLQEAFGRDIPKDNAFHALNVHAIGNSFNPLTERLKELAAHKVDRPVAKSLPFFLLGVPEGDEYAQQVWCAFMRAAVLRAFQPGVPVQWMPVLYGPQGCGKSYVARLMAMRDEWFVDSVTDVADPKALTEATAGRWICELAELAGLSRRRMEATKAAITRTEDICREAYARKTEPHPRRFVFIGTTNDHGFLCDETGERRFYPITCATTRPGINLVAENEKARVLIRWAWGEVASQYLEARCRADSDDELLRIFPPEPPAETQRTAERVRADFKEPDPQREAIEAYLEEHHERVCVQGLATEALGLTNDDIFTNGHASRAYKNVQGILDAMPGWHRVGRQRTRYGTVMCWEPN